MMVAINERSAVSGVSDDALEAGETLPPVAGYKLWLPFDADDAPAFSQAGLTGPLAGQTHDIDGTYTTPQLLVVKNGAADRLRIGTFQPGAMRGALIEELLAANQLLRSDNYGTTKWTKNGVSVEQNTADLLSPEGLNTADKLTKSSAGASKSISQTFAGTAGEKVAFRVWVRAGSLNTVTIDMVSFTFSDAIVVRVVIGDGNSVQDPTGDSWDVQGLSTDHWSLLEIISANDVGADPNNAVAFSIYPGGKGSGNNGGYLYLWRSQAESRGFATTQVRTTASSPDRVADVLEYDSTDFGTGALTAFICACPQFDKLDPSSFTIFDTREDSDSDGVLLWHRPGSDAFRLTVREAGVVQKHLTSTIGAARGSRYIFALALDDDDFRLEVHDVTTSVSDTQVDTTAGLLVPTSHDNCRIGHALTDASYWCGTVRDLLVYQSRLSNADITTVVDWLKTRI